MPRGNPDNLRAAAQRKSEAAAERADKAIRELIKRGEPITFRTVARVGGVSADFLYRHTELRRRIERLRDQSARALPAVRAESSDGDGNVVRALTAQLTESKLRHRDECKALQNALAAAHGEILALRRNLGGASTVKAGSGRLSTVTCQ